MSNTDPLEHGQKILSITHAVICGRSIDNAEMAFATLRKVDLEAAIHLADLLVLASPDSAPLWQAIIDHMAKEHPQSEDSDERQSGPAMSDDDAQDTARDVAAHLGWRDVEAGSKDQERRDTEKFNKPGDGAGDGA